jgi:hypothetical protein
MNVPVLRQETMVRSRIQFESLRHLDLLPRAIGALVFLSRHACERGDADHVGASLLSLAKWGVSREEMEWLVNASYVAPAAADLTNAGAQAGDYRSSSFVVTPAGTRFLKQIFAAIDRRDEATRGGDSPSERPAWDGRELRYLGALLKRFDRPAPNQERLLDEFERQGWTRYIENPLNEAGDISPVDRLRDAVKRLNRSLVTPLLHFGGNGRGTGVCWRAVAVSQPQ